jgi:DedD protein
MDEQLKRRLMGAAIVTALAVIFVPMAFEDKSAAPAETAAADIPTVPDTIEQTAIELPKSPEDVAQPEAAAPERQDGKKAPETGSYRIVPLEDAPPKPAPAPAKAAGPGAGAPSDAEAEEEEEFADDEGGEASAVQPAVTGPKASLAPGKTADKGKAPAPQKVKPAAKVAADAPTPAVPEEAPRPAAPAKPKAAPAKAPEPIAPKPKAAPAPARAPAEPPVVKNPNPKPVAEAAPAEAAAPKPAPVAQGTPAKPMPAKPKEAAGAPSTWVVQAGSFTAEANAKALVEKLRKQNLPANIHITHKESGDIYRVTVGPELNRARAEQMQKQVEGAVGIKGILLPRH